MLRVSEAFASEFGATGSNSWDDHGQRVPMSSPWGLIMMRRPRTWMSPLHPLVMQATQRVCVLEGSVCADNEHCVDMCLMHACLQRKLTAHRQLSIRLQTQLRHGRL